MYTPEDLAAVTKARVDLATGDRVTRITVRGTTTEYGQTDDAKLAQLQSEIQRVLKPKKRRPFYLSTSKGI